MIDMEVLNDAELLNNLVIRSKNNHIFTYVGPTLLAVNPFKKFPEYYTSEMRQQYIKIIVPARNSPLIYKELPPHIYAIAAEAYRSLLENDNNQTIVISGESGAGKTENAKFCMNLLTSIGEMESLSQS
jgi:myosin-5